MQKSTERILTTHTGSLPRPSDLTRLYALRSGGKAVRNEHYDTLDAYLAALGNALQVEYEAIVQHGFLLQIDAPDLALERHITYKDQPLAAFIGFVERVVATINKAIASIPREH